MENNNLLDYAPGHLIFRQGEAADCVYVLRKGAVDVRINASSDSPAENEIRAKGITVSHITHPGSLVGEAGIFIQRRTASLLADMDTGAQLQRMQIGPNGAAGLITSHPEVGLSLCKSLAGRLRHFNQQIRAYFEIISQAEDAHDGLALEFSNFITRLRGATKYDPTLTAAAERAQKHPFGELGFKLRQERQQTVAIFNADAAKQRINADIVAPGTIICREGEPGNCVYLVLEGELEVLVGEKRIAVTNVGSFIGEMAVLCQDNPRRNATVRAITAARLATISANEFHERILKHPNLMVSLANTLSGRLDRINKLIGGVPSDIADVLSSLHGGELSCSAAFEGLAASISSHSKYASEIRVKANFVAHRAHNLYNELKERLDTLRKTGTPMSEGKKGDSRRMRAI